MRPPLLWLNPVTGEVTSAIDEPPRDVGGISDDRALYMGLDPIAGLAACGYSTTLITDGGSEGGELFGVTPERRRGHLRVFERPHGGRVIQVPSHTRVRQVIP